MLIYTRYQALLRPRIALTHVTVDKKNVPRTYTAILTVSMDKFAPGGPPLLYEPSGSTLMVHTSKKVFSVDVCSYRYSRMYEYEDARSSCKLTAAQVDAILANFKYSTELSPMYMGHRQVQRPMTTEKGL